MIKVSTSEDNLVECDFHHNDIFGCRKQLKLFMPKQPLLLSSSLLCSAASSDENVDAEAASTVSPHSRPLSPLHLPAHAIAEESVSVRMAARTLSRLHLCWGGGCHDGSVNGPKSIMIVAKETPDDPTALCEHVAKVVEACVAEGRVVHVQDTFKGHGMLPGQGKLYSSDRLPEHVDLVITLGGDGTVLAAAWLFQTVVPPLIPFHLGSLGFLTVFDFDEYRQVLSRVLDSNVSSEMLYPMDETEPIESPLGPRIQLRMRLRCQLLRAQGPGEEI